ncbi:glycosyltransferase family 4 protein [Dyadobacter sp. CY327]|uniref:glycosyltransferase family 4 protein n=1 Tax=Dyadobacter sp. CY327 TaxID=2907301 RepID=UPI001F38263E|nr:glycosyltransferase family 4 protein [Dyadobacter sp. CY327]MCE7071012.1 glycosyltransferase family 4 protein [Dyadobacter sp. CY327]
MKVLFIGPLPDPINGCSLANQVLLNRLNQEENLYTTVINTGTSDMSSKNVGFFSFKKVFHFLKSYRSVLSVLSHDVIYSTPGQTFFGIAKYAPFYLLSIISGKPYTIHIHGNHLGNEYKILSGIKKSLFKLLISKAQAGIVLSTSLKKNFDGLLAKEKIFIVENFTEDGLLHGNVVKKDSSQLRLLFLSNLMREKGIIEFLDALLILQNLGIDFHVDVAGKMEVELEDVIREKFELLKGRLVYHNVVTGQAKRTLLYNSNVFVLPTFYRMEGQPISLIEAMATGNVVVTTKFSGIPDIVSNKNGFFVEKENSKSLADTLIHLSDNLHRYVTEMGSYNTEYVKSNFTEKIFSEKILKVIYATSKSK